MCIRESLFLIAVCCATILLLRGVAIWRPDNNSRAHVLRLEGQRFDPAILLGEYQDGNDESVAGSWVL